MAGEPLHVLPRATTAPVVLVTMGSIQIRSASAVRRVPLRATLAIRELAPTLTTVNTPSGSCMAVILVCFLLALRRLFSYQSLELFALPTGGYQLFTYGTCGIGIQVSLSSTPQNLAYAFYRTRSSAQVRLARNECTSLLCILSTTHSFTGNTYVDCCDIYPLLIFWSRPTLM